MKKIISFLLSGIILITGISMTSTVFAEKVTLCKTKVSVKQFEQVNIDVISKPLINTHLMFEYDNQNAEAVDFGVGEGDAEANKIGIIGIKPGKTKITVYLNEVSKKKTKIGTIDVTVRNNSKQSQKALKKALREKITVKKGCTTNICVFKKRIAMKNCRVVVSSSKKAKATNICRYPEKFAKTSITGKKLGEANAKVYIAPRFALKTSKETIKIHAKSRIYIGKTKIKVVKSKKSTLKERKCTLDYQEASVRKIFPLNVDDKIWNDVSAKNMDEFTWNKLCTMINQKIYLKDLVNTYDKKSTYTLKSSNKDIIAIGKNKMGIYIWAKKAGSAKITIHQKEPKKKKVKVGTVKISTGNVITLADAANAWEEMSNDSDSYNTIHYGDKRVYVLDEEFRDTIFPAPSKDTYTVEYINNAPEYLTVSESGEITWYRRPECNEITRIVTAHLTFIDGSKTTINFRFFQDQI